MAERPRGKWSDPGVPHKGWACVDFEDLEDLSGVCGMCETQEIRYVHYMQHPGFEGLIGAGYDCAARMSEDYEGAKNRERVAKNRTKRRAGWLDRNWKTSAKGNPYLKADGFVIVIFRKATLWGAIIEDKTMEEKRFSQRLFNTENASKAAVACSQQIAPAGSRVLPCEGSKMVMSLQAGQRMHIEKPGREWKYQAGDRTLETGLFDHYRAIIRRQIFYRRYDAWGQPFYAAQEHFFGEQGDPFYFTFDTTLIRGYPAYSWVDAVKFEGESSLDFRPPAEFVPIVLAKAQLCVEQQVPYSVLKQTDCDSLTRWLYTNERWNRQLATTVGGLILTTLAFAVVDSLTPPKRRRRRS